MKGGKTFDSLARQAGRQKLPVCACTLRRALDGRLPTRYTVLAFARGVSADKKKAEQMWAAAARASRPLPSRTRRYVPGRISTRAGLARVLDKLKTDAQMSLRELAAAPAAAGLLTRSSLHNALTGQRLPTERWLEAFAAACGADDDADGALVDARRRILAGPRPPAVYPCAIAERADEQRQMNEADRPWLDATVELDEYDQQLRDEEEAAFRYATAWVNELTDDELRELQEQSAAARAGRDIRAELRQYLTHARPAAAPHDTHPLYEA
ncbi:helix-turn-helix domain-containing protein [Streptomyces sp. NPDC088736]|uniref:helix-turn-helix domain-containing protein n=1 Tax=Streptomyces sp. NPDC088736 TaxID=3365881 RepID=UPI0037FD1561